MKKKNIIFSIVALLLTSCNNANNANSKTDENEKCTIEFYVYDNANAYKKLASQFNLIYPNWNVSVRENKANYFDNLKTYFGANMAPDMFFMEPGEISSFIRDDLLLNLQPYINEGVDLKESDLWEANDGYRYNTTTNKLGDKDGDLYALAKDLSADFMMVYNKNHIDEYNSTHEVSLYDLIKYPSDDKIYPSETIPMSWEQNEMFCHYLSKFDDNGNFLRYGTVFDYIPWRHVMEFVQQQKSSLFIDDGKTFNAEDERVIAAFKHLTNYFVGENKSSTPLDTKSVDTGIGFKSQSVSVVWAGRWSFKAYNWDDMSFDYGIAPGPVRNLNDEVFTSTSFVGISISATSKHKDVAYKFLEYILTSGVRQEIKNNESFNVPANKSIASSSLYLNADNEKEAKLNNYFYNMTNIAKPLLFSQYIDTTTMEAKLGLNYGATWTDNESVENALLNCKRDIETEIKKVIARS